MDWLLDGLAHSRARWNVIANQVMMARQRTTVTDPSPLSVDAWDGYTADRQRLFDGIQERKVDGVCVLTGDTHANYAADLKQNFDDGDSGVWPDWFELRWDTPQTVDRVTLYTLNSTKYPAAFGS